ncbi:hypothetical protein RclHR1_24430001 [Rhizophagus clarus]|uniref:Uncharacterized protein n=1 Tax=Rhizophagus clarus TaxID=94130 RepID=A0A2Z6RDA7_9GLOM|nr:hypothetical protein RclHR1_24430001 [Rhizophagus clarus]GES72609.1 hypothetical protein GLOIN_2v1764121 [Rhizophagus clarus]
MRIHDATLSYQYPSEYDDFETFRNVYHSLGSVYVQFENMPAYQRKLLKNHFILRFVPFDSNFNKFMLSFVSEMKEFEQGKLMKVNGKDSWVIASLDIVTANLSQGNDMAGVLRHNANKDYCTYTASQKSLTNSY